MFLHPRDPSESVSTCAMRRAGNLASLKSLEIAKNAITGSIPDGELHQHPILHVIEHQAHAHASMVPCFSACGIQVCYSDTCCTPLLLAPPCATTVLSKTSARCVAGIAALPSLKLLDLSDNVMSGPLPSDWSRATQLSFMLLENNAFSGTPDAHALPIANPSTEPLRLC